MIWRQGVVRREVEWEAELESEESEVLSLEEEEERTDEK